ncbi:MAG: DUF6763 family protein [Gammaproteobacteria bacterium]|nr:DUF6763 family protein [Gammaproteobacteria bacterium]
MPTYEPRIGDWYRNHQQQTFEVVAYDPEEDTVEIQYFDGDVEELELDAWNELEINPVDPPEDWSGPFDGIGREEMGDVETPGFNGSIDTLLDDLDRND